MKCEYAHLPKDVWSDHVCTVQHSAVDGKFDLNMYSMKEEKWAPTHPTKSLSTAYFHNFLSYRATEDFKIRQGGIIDQVNKKKRARSKGMCRWNDMIPSSEARPKYCYLCSRRFSLYSVHTQCETMPVFDITAQRQCK